MTNKTPGRAINALLQHVEANAPGSKLHQNLTAEQERQQLLSTLTDEQRAEAHASGTAKLDAMIDKLRADNGATVPRRTPRPPRTYESKAALFDTVAETLTEIEHKNRGKPVGIEALARLEALKASCNQELLNDAMVFWNDNH